MIKIPYFNVSETQQNETITNYQQSDFNQPN